MSSFVRSRWTSIMIPDTVGEAGVHTLRQEHHKICATQKCSRCLAIQISMCSRVLCSVWHYTWSQGCTLGTGLQATNRFAYAEVVQVKTPSTTSVNLLEFWWHFYLELDDDALLKGTKGNKKTKQFTLWLLYCRTIIHKIQIEKWNVEHFDMFIL